MSNFRPITNLNTIGKILEHLAMKQLRQHSDHSPNLGHLQSSYRALHSTETAMTKVVSDLLSAVDGGEPSALLSLYISAAFIPLHQCCVRHLGPSLSSVLRAWAIRLFDSVLKSMQSYLSDHQHWVAMGGCRSTFVTNLTGVPQTSVLDSFLFSIFTTPVGNIIDSFGIYDDQAKLFRQVREFVHMCRCGIQLAPGKLSTPQPKQNGVKHNWYQTADREIRPIGWRRNRRHQCTFRG